MKIISKISEVINDYRSYIKERKEKESAISDKGEKNSEWAEHYLMVFAPAVFIFVFLIIFILIY